MILGKELSCKNFVALREWIWDGIKCPITFIMRPLDISVPFKITSGKQSDLKTGESLSVYSVKMTFALLNNIIFPQQILSILVTRLEVTSNKTLPDDS